MHEQAHPGLGPADCGTGGLWPAALGPAECGSGGSWPAALGPAECGTGGSWPAALLNTRLLLHQIMYKDKVDQFCRFVLDMTSFFPDVYMRCKCHTSIVGHS